MGPVQFVCPFCRIKLQQRAEQFACPQCGREYTSHLGITSLIDPNVRPSAYEALLVQRLTDMYPSATFEELVSARITSAAISKDCQQNYVQYGLTLRERGIRFHRMFQHRLEQQGWTSPRRKLGLDIGCGVGAGLIALSRDFEQVVGVDLSLSALIAAKKLVEDEKLSNVTLVHATAHHLPFLDGAFDYVMAINVLEHILTPETFLAETHRVLTIDGAFCGDSRNRFDLFFPEPHVGLRWVGFLPRRWMAGYVRWRIGVDYHAMHTRLLSYRDLKRALMKSFGNEWRVVLPDVSVYGMPDALYRWVEFANRFKSLHPFLIRLSSSHLVLARHVA